MNTKWLNKLDEKQLVGFEIYEGSEIVWARKTEVENNSVVELIYLQEGANCEQFNRFVDFFKANCEREIHGENVEKFLTENEFEIDEYMNFLNMTQRIQLKPSWNMQKKTELGLPMLKLTMILGTLLKQLEQKALSIQT